MTNRKNHNSIIFLTTLSVYLGLVLVGATPQISAQTVKQSVDKNVVNFLAPGAGMVFTFDLNPIIELNRLVSKEALPVEISGKLVPLSQEVTHWEIISAKGNQDVLDFLRKEFFSPLQVSPPAFGFLQTKENFQSIEVDRDDITFVRNIVFVDQKNAVYIEKCYRWIIDYAKSPTADKKIAGNPYITNTQVRAENNQVFIVTRLPRGSIESLLATKNAQ